MFFADRKDAGEKLGQALQDYRGRSVTIVAIPRGGVVVGSAVAEALDAGLEVIIPRKIGAPGNPELAVGAVAEEGSSLLNEDLIRGLGVSRAYLDREIARQLQEIERRKVLYDVHPGAPHVEGRIAILVDDGLATGFTALAAVRAMHRKNPEELVLAVPVAPPDTIGKFQSEVDKVVCLYAPSQFYAVGQFYLEFDQTTDQEVREILGRHRAKSAAS